MIVKLWILTIIKSAKMEMARELGYQLVGQNNGKPSQRRAWIYLPTGKKEYMSLDQMRYRKARGLLEVVNKEPPLTKYIRAHGKNPNDPIVKMFQDMADVNLSAFDEASPEIQALAISYAKEWFPRIKRFESLHIRRSPSKARNEAMMLAYAFCLNAMSLDRKHQAVAVLYRRDDAWGASLVPEYRYINEDTVHLINNMINWMFRGTEFDHDYTDSNKALLMHSVEWEQMKLLFKKLAVPTMAGKPVRIAGRVRRAGFFPYLSISKKYDLSRFGIYHEFDIENYREPCFIQVYREYMAGVYSEANELSQLSQLNGSNGDDFQNLVDQDCEFLNSIMKSPRIPVDKMELLSKVLNLNMIRRVFNNSLDKLDSPKRYPKTSPRFQKDFEILYHTGHFMIWEKGICPKLKEIRKKELFVELSTEEQDLAKKARLQNPNTLQARAYSEFCCVPMERKIPYRTNIDRFFMMDELSPADKPEIARRLSDILNIGVLEHSSLAALGQNLMHRRGCYTGVMGLRGPPAEFIRKCLCPIVLGAPHDEPIRIESTDIYNDGSTNEYDGRLCQYDRKSSYPSVYTQFPGIPMGKPIVINGLTDLSELNEQYDPEDPDDQCHFYVCLDIKAFRCMHEDDPYPLLCQTGYRWMDRTQYELMMEHYDVDYDFISGYYFKGYNRNIGKLATWLYQRKVEVESIPREEKTSADVGLAMVLKNLMNGMWGKAMSKGYLIPSSLSNSPILSGGVKSPS
jgi:hypothetical protein